MRVTEIFSLGGGCASYGGGGDSGHYHGGGYGGGGGHRYYRSDYRYHDYDHNNGDGLLGISIGGGGRRGY